VGLGSYIVNVQADCNGCHSAGPDTEFTPSGNPYLLPPVFSGKKKINPDTYLGGGNDFGPFPGPGPFPHIVSRNLTPDNTGLPEGGASFEEFRTILRTGKDLITFIRSVQVTPTAPAFRFRSTAIFFK
jgi:hypothetical protein